MRCADILILLCFAAYVLNLRGEDVPFNPVFHSYLFVGLESAILFIEDSKLTEEVKGYLTSIGVTWRDYNDLWTFLRRKEWGEGNVRLFPDTAFISDLILLSRSSFLRRRPTRSAS